MRRSAWFLCCAALAARARAADPPDVRVEHFVLECAAEAADGCADSGNVPARKIGVAVWRRRRFAEGMQLECETTFFAGPSEPDANGANGETGLRRVLHVEHLGPAGPRLVWREIGAGTGRSLLAEWTDDGRGLRTVEWGGTESLREVIDTRAGAVMPLYLLELVRNGQAISGHYPRFDPLARALEPVEIRTSYAAGDPVLAFGAADGAPPEVRTVELVRVDGSLAGRFRFRGAQLIHFQWQDGPLAARAIDEREYESLLEEEERAQDLGRDPGSSAPAARAPER